jgi:hypothetical protein
MSKKLIAVASAAALALSVLVGVAPASATTTISGGGNNSGLTSALAKVVTVPEDNEVDTGEMVTFTVSSAADRTISATSTGGVKMLTTTADPDGADWASTDGVTTLSMSTGVNTSMTFYAFTTSTATGTVVVNDGVGNTQTFYMKGTAGAAYNIDVTAPTSIATTGTGSAMQIKVTDVFGNALASLGSAGILIDTLGSGSSVHETASGNAITAAFTTTANYNTTKKVFEVNLRSTTGGGVAVNVALQAVSGQAGAPADVTGLAKARASFFASINATDLATQVAELTKQVAALQATVAKRVTKKRYNTLARKWNAANPSAKVALKK